MLEVLLQTPIAAHINRFIAAPNETLHAPHLIDLEVAHVLRRYVHSAVITAQRGAEALADLSDFPLKRYPHFILLGRIWQLRHSLTAYDAAYLALADSLRATLLTRDRALAGAGGRVRVEVV
jgi:predicted nucleic acid-binding protein